MENMENEKKKLECEIASLELLLRWKGIPTFAFISGIAALTWALFLEMKPGNVTEIPLVLSVLVSRIVWSLLNEKLFSNSTIRESLELFRFFMDDIKNEVRFEIILDLTCIFLLSRLNLHSWFMYGMYSYFFLNIFINLCGLIVIPSFEVIQKTKILDKLRWMESQWFIFLHKTFNFIFKVWLAIQYLLTQSLNVRQFRQCLIILGLILLIQFYFVGSYILTVLEGKRKDLRNLFSTSELIK